MNYSLIEQDLEETPEGEVYFIFEKNTLKPCKIGKSKHPKKRTLQLQTGNYREMYIYQTLKGYSRLEIVLHKHFNEHRIRKTEWFDITFEDVDEIIEQYQSEKEQILENELEEKDNILEEELVDEKELIEEVIEETKTIHRVYQVKKHICEKCGKDFTENRYLQVHLKRKTACNEKFTCPKCEKPFTNTHNLQAHLNRITPCVSEKIPKINITKSDHRCKFCNKTYSSTYNLKRHMKTCDREPNMRYIIELMAEKVIAEKEKTIQLRQQLQLLVDNDQTSTLNQNNIKN